MVHFESLDVPQSVKQRAPAQRLRQGSAPATFTFRGLDDWRSQGLVESSRVNSNGQNERVSESASRRANE